MFELEFILLLSLFSPLVELFPNLYMSWWLPSNGNKQKYLDTWLRRVLVVFIVWIPILIILAKIVDNNMLIWGLGALILTAFGLRLYVFDKFLKTNISTTPLLKVPEFLYFIAFSSIGAILYKAVPNNDWLVPLGIGAIFLGAFIISTFREKKNANLVLDVIGRIIFSAGFLLNLYNIVRAVSIVV